MKNAIFLAAVSVVFSSVSFAKSTTVECRNDEYSVDLKIVGSEVVAFSVTSRMQYADLNPSGWQDQDGAYSYSILVDDGNDTNMWFEIKVKDGAVIKRELAISGNDSDNYTGSVEAEGDAAFICN